MPEKCRRSVSTLSRLLDLTDDDAYKMLTVYSIMTDLPTSDQILLDMILEDNHVDSY